MKSITIALAILLGMLVPARASAVKPPLPTIELHQMLELTILNVKLLNQVPVTSKSGKTFVAGDICTMYRTGEEFLDQIVEDMVLLSYRASESALDDECPTGAIAQYPLKEIAYLIMRRDAEDAEKKFIDQFPEMVEVIFTLF